MQFVQRLAVTNYRQSTLLSLASQPREWLPHFMSKTNNQNSIALCYWHDEIGSTN